MTKNSTPKGYVYSNIQRGLKSNGGLLSQILKNKSLCLFITGIFYGMVLTAQTVVINPTSPFTVPIGVTSVKVEVWGAGGGGGGAVGAFLSAKAAGGGGGGAFKTSTFSVSGGQAYTITYGAAGAGGTTAPTAGGNGGATTFTGPAGTVSANGGTGGAAANQANSNGGAGGTSGTFNGGAGGNSTGNGAGGGGAAGNNAAGTGGGNASTGVGGAGLPNVAPYIGGNGGAFRSSNGNGNAGVSPSGGGGGGKGASFFGTATGGNGAAARVVLTYTLPPCVTPPVGGTASGPGSSCAGTLTTYTVSGGSGSIQWQSATAIGGPYTDVSGAVVSTFNVTPSSSGTIYYRVKRQSAGCTDDFSNILTVVTNTTPGIPGSGSGFSVCPGGSGTISVSNTATLSTTLTFAIASQPAETNAAPGNTIASVSMPALPGGATVTSATLTLNNITALGSSWQSDVRLGFSGAVVNTAAAGTGATNAAGTFNYTRAITGVNAAGGTVNLLYWDYVSDNTGIEANFNAPTSATLVINYTLPVTIEWYDAPTGGTLLGTSTPFNPIGTTVLPNTATAGMYNFYAQGVIGSCTSPSRLLVPVIIKEPPVASVNSNAPVCSLTALALSADNIASGQSSGNTYQWSGPSSFVSSQQNPSVTSSATVAHVGVYTVTITNQFLCTASGTHSVSVNANPALVISTQTNITCNGDGDGTVNVTASGGSIPYLFFDGSNFLTDNSGVTFTGYTPGPYCFYVVDNNGCDNAMAAPACVTITEPDVLAFSTSPINVDCAGNSNGAVTVIATGGTAPYLYSNDNGTSFQATNSFTGLAIGTYDIIVKDAHNCITTASSVTISIQYTSSSAPTAVTTDDDNNEICNGSSITLTQSGGSLSTAPGTVYKWYDAGCNGALIGSGASIIVSPTAASSYFVKADGLCGVTLCASTSVAVSLAAPSQSVVMPINNLPATACIGTLINNISVSAVSLATQYIWDGPSGCNFNGSGNPFTVSSPSADIIFGNPNGSGYYIGVQAANACGSTVRKVQWVRGIVSVPAAVSGNTTVCENTQGTYTTGAITGASNYVWTITGDATISGNSTTATVVFGPSWNGGTICVAAQTSCYTSAAKCLTLSRAASIITQINGATAACSGQTINYFVAPVNGAATYLWTLPPGTSGSSSTNSINVTFNPSFIGGDISVSVLSTCGVPSPVKSKTINNGTPPVPASVTGPLTGLCEQTIVYSCPSSPGATYNWTVPSGATVNSGQGTNAISVTYGTFNTSIVCVTASNTCGTSASRCITVTGRPNTPGAITTIPGSWCANTAGVEFDVDVSLLTGSYTLSWLYPPSSVATYVLGGGNSTSLILNWSNGSGQVQVTASNACGGQTRTSVQGNSCRESNQEIVSNTHFSVYPNPASTILNIDFNHDSKAGYVICLKDISGRVVLSKSETAKLTTLDVSKLAKGIYMMEIGGSVIEKMKVVIN